MNTTTKHQRNNQTFTITVKPPDEGCRPMAPGGPNELSYTIEVKDSKNGTLYFESISESIAIHIQMKCALNIAEFLTQFGNNFIDEKYP